MQSLLNPVERGCSRSLFALLDLFVLSLRLMDRLIDEGLVSFEP